MSKRFLSLIVTLVLVAATLLSTTTLVGATGEVVYIVVKDDNLWTLAEKYLGSGPKFDAIMAATNAKHAEDPSFAYIEAAGKIQTGWKLLIPSAGAAPSVAGSWTVQQKCEWLKVNFPQAEGNIQQLIGQRAGVPVNRVVVHLYRCSGTETVFDGAIILGPTEGWSVPFTVAVPTGGVVDVYVGAICTGVSKQIGANTVQCLSGSVVNVLRASYWPWNDDAPPISVTSVVSPTTPTAQVCMLGKDLAAQKGWSLEGTQDSNITKYGGARVQKGGSGNLPSGWEEICDPGGSGVCSIYPPQGECRDRLGVSR